MKIAAFVSIALLVEAAEGRPPKAPPGVGPEQRFDVCHYDEDEKQYVLLSLPAPGKKAHENHEFDRQPSSKLGKSSCLFLTKECEVVKKTGKRCGGGNRFRFLEGLEEFEAYPDSSQISAILDSVDDGYLEAKISFESDILPKEALDKARDFVEDAFENKELVTEAEKKEFKLKATGKDLVDLFGSALVEGLLDFLRSHTGEEHPVTSAFFQRFDHDGTTVSPYHTDGYAMSLVILLNDDFDGGEMTYLTEEGPIVVESVAGAATIHGPGAIHGNAAVHGIKYQLTLLTFPKEVLGGNIVSIFGGGVLTN